MDGERKALQGWNEAVVDVTGLVAEWSCSGLQIRVRRFDSDPSLQVNLQQNPRKSQKPA